MYEILPGEGVGVFGPNGRRGENGRDLGEG